MGVSEFVDEIYGPVDLEGLSDSDRVYMDFRRTVDPGMLDAKFDVTPAKSCAIRDRTTGERHTDQTLRSHVLNGASFGARLNHALRQLDPDAALSDERLMKALALYSCHDLHKTIPAQIRRAEAEDRPDADKDLSEEEVASYVARLRLEDLDTELQIEDYRASALAAEEWSGRHRDAPSRVFDRHRDWIRVMDAAAGLTSTTEVEGLKARIKAISDNVELATHRVDDTKGLVTNHLHSTLVKEAEKLESVVPLVYFASGVLYLSTDADALEERFSGGEAEAEALTNAFISTIRNSGPGFRDPVELTSNLNDDYQKGSIGIPSSLHLLAGLETSIKSVKYLIGDRSDHATYDDYNIYRYAVSIGVAGDLFKSEIPPASKSVPVGLQLSTFYQEVFKPLCDGNRRDAIHHISRALGIAEQGDWISESTEGWRLKYADPTPNEEAVRHIADHLELDEDKVWNDLEEGITLESGGTLATPVVLAMVFIANGREEGTNVSDFPLEEVLRIVESRLLEYYHGWQEEWDQTAPVDVDTMDSSEGKVKQFERDKEGLIWLSFPAYLGENLEVNGQRTLKTGADKTKFKEYSSETQPHVCLLCDDLLVGSGRLDDFKSETLYFGFTHYRPINPKGGEPTGTVCPQCDVELTLRNAVHGFSPDSHFLLLAPDYFFSPGDLEFAENVRKHVHVPGGYDLQRLADSVVTGDQIRRSRRATDIFEAFSFDEEDGERVEFRNLVKNYNRAYEEDGALGIYRIDPPRRSGGSEPITRIPRWFVSAFSTIAIAWLTSSRALLAESPIPTTEFDQFPEMIRFEHLPGAVQSYTGESVTASLRRHLDERPHEITIRSRLSGQSPHSRADDARSMAVAEALDHSDTPAPLESDADSSGSSSPVPVELTFHTDLEVKLQTLASLLTVTGQQHGADLQRVKTVMDRAKDPFPGAGTVLKGDETLTYPAALHAALVLDTLRYPSMSNRIKTLADAGFETLHPDPERDTNYEYERLFRVARDSLSDGLAQNATHDELVDIITGDVMKAAARADESDYGEERVKRESAEEFANRFVDEVYLGICDGDFYELRRHENHLASGYNAAVRRREQEFWDEHRDNTNQNNDH